MSEQEPEPEEPAADEPGVEPTSLEDGAEAEDDEPAEGLGTHRGW